MSFKVGDRVKVYDTISFDAKEGVIRKIVTDEDRSLLIFYAVEFDPPFVGHTCDDILTSKRGWWCRHDQMELIPNSDINIDKDIPKFSYDIQSRR